MHAKVIGNSSINVFFINFISNLYTIKMKHISFKVKKIVLFAALYLIILSSTYQVSAQTYHTVDHASGSVLIGPVNNQSLVTVDTFGNVPTINSTVFPCPFRYRIGVCGICPSANLINGYTYSFNPPISRLRLDVPGLDSAEVLTVYINGSKYNITSPNLSAHPCSSGAALPIIVNGSLTSNVGFLVDPLGRLDFAPGYLIDSVSIENSSWSYAGIGYVLQFALDTVIYVKKPFNDTMLCANDSLYLDYLVGNQFNNPNTFTAQLSDASGSFSSPTTIGTLSSRVAGTIPCKLPNGISGNGYRVRIVSTNPVRTSPDNGKNIKISNVIPAGVTAGSNSPICDGSNLVFSGSSTTSGVAYKWTGPNSFTSTTQNPTITSAGTFAAGVYSLTASLNGCEASTNTTVQIKPIPATPTASNNGPACTGGGITLSGNSTTPGVTYSWTGPSNFSSSVQNPTLNNLTLSMAGNYAVTATLNNCTSVSGTTAVTVNNGPKINIFPSPSNVTCIGDSITFISLPADTNAGSTFQWMKNGLPIAGETSFKYKGGSFSNGDVISCQLTPGPGGTCSTPISSLQIPVTVLNTLSPSVAINVMPGNDVWQDLMVTFTTTTINAGTNPKYQWKKNGQNIVGATGKEWSATNLDNGDEISCDIVSDYQCPDPETASSNSIKMIVRLSVNDKEWNTGVLNVYPNPVMDVLYISQPIESAYAIADLTGRIVKTGNVDVKSNTIDVASLNAGMYILHLQTTDASSRLKFTKK